jgi:hypothetical protein
MPRSFMHLGKCPRKTPQASRTVEVALSAIEGTSAAVVAALTANVSNLLLLR